MAIGTAVIPAVVPVVVGNPEGLGVRGIGTIEVIDAPAQTQTVAAVGNLLRIEPLLLQLDAVLVRIERSEGIVGVVADVRPATDVQAQCIVCRDQSPWLTQAAPQATTGHRVAGGSIAATRTCTLAVIASISAAAGVGSGRHSRSNIAGRYRPNLVFHLSNLPLVYGFALLSLAARRKATGR